MKTIKPNHGPYIVSWYIESSQISPAKKEYQTWKDACEAMRNLLINGCIHVSVKFA